MSLKYWFHRMMITCIVILSLIFFAVVDMLITSSDVSEELFSPENFLINLPKYVPIGILGYLLIRELFQLFLETNQSLNFTLKEDGIVFIHNFSVWMALFETDSIKEIQIDELTQLDHLETFSLELNINKSYLRLYIFSKKLDQLKDRIAKSKAILEIVLPRIKPATNETIMNFLANNKSVNIDEKFVLIQDEDYLIAHTTRNPNQFPKTFTNFILAYNSAKNLNNTQTYFFNAYKKWEFFNLLENMTSNDYQHYDKEFLEYQQVQRIRIRYQTENFRKIPYNEALQQLKTGLLQITTNFQSKETGRDEAQVKLKRKIKPPSKKISQTNNFKTKEIITQVIKDVISEEKNIPVVLNKPKDDRNSISKKQDIVSLTGINQICLELCNITQNKDLGKVEKSKRCQLRSSFSKKLLNNQNFVSLLDNVLNQKYKEEQEYLINQLKQHVSSHQLICILVHLTQVDSDNISPEKILSMLYILLESNNQSISNPDIGNNSSSPILTNKKGVELFPPSTISTS